MKIPLLILVTLLFSFISNAQTPSDYYDSAESLTGEQLKSALHPLPLEGRP